MANGKKGSHRVDPPAKPGANHFGNFNQAIKDALDKDTPAGEYDLTLEVTVNPGSIKDYRIVFTPR